MTDENGKHGTEGDARARSAKRGREDSPEAGLPEEALHEGKPRRRESQGGETSNEQSGRAGGPGPE